MNELLQFFESEEWISLLESLDKVDESEVSMDAVCRSIAHGKATVEAAFNSYGIKCLIDAFIKNPRVHIADEVHRHFNWLLFMLPE